MTTTDKLVTEFLANPLHPVALLEVLHGEVKRQQNNLAAVTSCETTAKTHYPKEYKRLKAKYRQDIERCQSRVQEAQWLLEFVGALPEALASTEAASGS